MIHLADGKAVTVNAPGASDRRFYVTALRVDGAVSTRTYLRAEALVSGAALDFDLGTSPTSWGQILAHTAGLRPARSTVRLEVEQVGGARCVHNYGHGGSGVALSWGTARAAAELLLN